MDKKWIDDEVRLWDAMFAKPQTSDRKKNAKLIAERKRRGHKNPSHGFITEEEAVARSWRAYERWVEH